MPIDPISRVNKTFLSSKIGSKKLFSLFEQQLGTKSYKLTTKP